MNDRKSICQEIAKTIWKMGISFCATK